MYPSSKTMGQPIEILLVEDNPADARLVLEGFKDAKVKNKLHVVADGVQAMAFLRREGAYTAVPRPDLVLLDLNLPRKDGREVLSEIKTDPALRRIPVAVLTSSDAEQDIYKSYDLHANCYLTKPLGIDQFNEVIRSIENFWLVTVKLPRA
jgi:chemotaxis family two-component system response regulator Rcp1